MTRTTKSSWLKGAVLFSNRLEVRPKRNHAIPTLAIILAVIFSYTPAFAGIVTVNVWESFPDNQGDNGFFAYRYAPTTGNYTLLQDTGSFWFQTPQTQWDAPSMAKYGSPIIRMWASGTQSNTGTPEDAVLAWVAPEETSYQIMGSWFADTGSGSNGMDAYIKQNNTVLWSSYLAPRTTHAFNVTGLLDIGDMIYFGVNAHNNNSFSELNDGAALIGAQIVYTTAAAGIPEPGTLGLFGLGLASLICLSRKRGYC